MAERRGDVWMSRQVEHRGSIGVRRQTISAALGWRRHNPVLAGASGWWGTEPEARRFSNYKSAREFHKTQGKRSK